MARMPIEKPLGPTRAIDSSKKLQLSNQDFWCSLVRILMTSFPTFSWLFVQRVGEKW